jgi:hypothetical protein
VIYSVSEKLIFCLKFFFPKKMAFSLFFSLSLSSWCDIGESMAEKVIVQKVSCREIDKLNDQKHLGDTLGLNVACAAGRFIGR